MDEPMAGKGVIFFTLGTLFGGLCSATIALSWPSPERAIAAKKMSARTQAKTPGALTYPTSSKSPGMNAFAKPLFAAGAAFGAAQAQKQEVFAPQPPTDQDVDEQHEDEEWTPEEEQAFFAQEKKLHEERQAQIEKMRQDLVSKAKLDGQEKGEFLSLVKEVTEKLLDGERKLEEIMGPIPNFDPDAPEEEQGGDSEDPPRLALLQNDFERSKALLSAQTRFEALLGPERLKALGPEFQSVEAFIKDEPLEENFGFSDQG